MNNAKAYITQSYQVSYKIGKRGKTRTLETRFPSNGLYKAFSDVKQFKTIRNKEDKLIKVSALDYKILFIGNKTISNKSKSEDIVNYLIKNPKILEESYDIRDFKVKSLGAKITFTEEAIKKLLED